MPTPSELGSTSTQSEHGSEVIVMHPITGTFADPERESAFRSAAFRLAFPFHAFLMALLVPLTLWAAHGAPSELLPVWYTRTCATSIALVGRVLTHRIKDPVRSQRVGAWCWSALVLLSCCVLDAYTFWATPATRCWQPLRESWAAAREATPLIYLGAALTNGTHGLGFRYKSVLLGLVLAVVISGTAAVCGTVMLVRLLFTTAAGTAGSVLAHIGELLWRRSVARHEEKLDTVDREKRRLEERNEQLRAEKERLLYDNALQRRSRPSVTFEDDERSVIRRGLSAQPYHPAGDAYPASESSRTTSSASDKAGPRHPSGSPPASLPPGPPSSAASKSSSSSGSGGAPAAAGSASVTSSVNEHEHTDVAVLGDRHLLELEVERWTETSSLTSSQGALLADLASALVTQPSSSAPEQSAGQAMAASDRAMQMKPEDTGEPGLGGEEPSQGPVPDPCLLRPPSLVAPLLPTATQQLVMPGTMPYTMVTQDTVNVNSTLSQVGPSCWPVGPSCSNVYSNAHGPPAVSLGSQSSTIASTPEQRALQAARDGMRAARGDIQRFYVLRTLATALGASRTETGTISALHAVLLQLDQPSLSCEEACEFTGASMSNFKKWRRRVHQARLNLPSEYRVNSEARHRIQ